MSDAALHHEFQYPSTAHQAETAISGMWLFLATEVLFFGVLFLGWLFARHFNLDGFDAGAQRTQLAIGTINTVLLVTSSLTYSAGLAFMEAGNVRRLLQLLAATWLLGLAFLILKFGIEWSKDFKDHLWPGPDFAIADPLGRGAQLFFGFYFIATAVHGVHMVIGLGLLAWLMLLARRGRLSAAYYTPVAVVGLYWSFVDMVWIVLYPLIYLIGRSP
jgi:cytochrome c oxidase subunit III